MSGITGTPTGAGAGVPVRAVDSVHHATPAGTFDAQYFSQSAATLRTCGRLMLRRPGDLFVCPVIRLRLAGEYTVTGRPGHEAQCKQCAATLKVRLAVTVAPAAVTTGLCIAGGEKMQTPATQELLSRKFDRFDVVRITACGAAGSGEEPSPTEDASPEHVLKYLARSGVPES